MKIYIQVATYNSETLGKCVRSAVQDALADKRLTVSERATQENAISQKATVLLLHWLDQKHCNYGLVLEIDFDPDGDASKIQLANPTTGKNKS
jgi:hypothetical protein